VTQSFSLPISTQHTHTRRFLSPCHLLEGTMSGCGTPNYCDENTVSPFKGRLLGSRKGMSRPLSGHSGHWSALEPNAWVANDPKADIVAFGHTSYT